MLTYVGVCDIENLFVWLACAMYKVEGMAHHGSLPERQHQPGECDGYLIILGRVED